MLLLLLREKSGKLNLHVVGKTVVVDVVDVVDAVVVVVTREMLMNKFACGRKDCCC